MREEGKEDVVKKWREWWMERKRGEEVEEEG